MAAHLVPLRFIIGWGYRMTSRSFFCHFKKNIVNLRGPTQAQIRLDHERTMIMLFNLN